MAIEAVQAAYILEDAAAEVAAHLPVPRVRGSADPYTYAASYGWDWASLIILFAPMILEILKGCFGTADMIQGEARDPGPMLQSRVRRIVRARIAGQYNLIGRIRYQRSIDRLSEEVSAAMFRSAATADVGRLAHVLRAVDAQQERVASPVNWGAFGW